MSLDLILGPMFAGKSSAILHRVNRYKSINWSVCLISHSFDTRYSEDAKLVNHDQLSVPCFRWSSLMTHKDCEAIQNSKVLIIDESQFFPDLLEFVLYAVESLSKHVIVVGLDGDANRKPFGQILNLIPLADSITKLKSYCTACADGTAALFSFYKKGSDKKEQVCVGGADVYTPLCRKHFLEFSNKEA